MRRRHLVNVNDAVSERIVEDLAGPDPQHEQYHLSIARVVLVPAVVKRFAGPSLRYRHDETQVGPFQKEPVCKGTMVFARCFEPDDNRVFKGSQNLNQPVMLRPPVGNRQALPPRSTGHFDQDRMAALGNVDGNKGGAAWLDWSMGMVGLLIGGWCATPP